MRACSSRKKSSEEKGEQCWTFPTFWRRTDARPRKHGVPGAFASGSGACGVGSREAVPESGAARARRVAAVSRASSASRGDSRFGLVVIAIPSATRRAFAFPPYSGTVFRPRDPASRSRSEGSASLRDRRRAVGRPRRGPRGSAAFALGRGRAAGADAARCGPSGGSFPRRLQPGCFAPRHAAAVRSRLRRSELPENIGFRPYLIFHSPSGKAARFGRYGAASARHAPRPPRESANRRGCPRGWDREREEVQAAYTPPHRRAPRDRRAGAPTARARDFRLRLPCPKGSNRRGRMPTPIS